ncbi:copia protein [Tanacetum coccineum]
MNLILISIPNEIYNSVDACTTTKSMWERVERLMRGTVQNKVDWETRFNNGFDQSVAEQGEALVSIYNHFAQLTYDLERNGITFPLVTVNTKFLNCLQPEWLKYVTQVRLAKRLTEDTYNDLFDYLQQFEKLVNASRAKKLEKSHDPLALMAHTGSSFRTISPYYVTHPSLVVDYDDDYQGDAVQNNFEDPLTTAMILLARAITQRFSNPPNNHLRTSSNTRNQAIVQADRVHIQSRNYGNDGRNTRRSYVPEEVIEGNNVQNDAGNIQRTLRTTSSGTAANVQCYNYSEKGHYARNCPKPRVQDSKYFMEQMLLAKQDEAGVTLTDKHNDFLFADATRMEEIEELSANICLMVIIQPTNINSDAGPSYDYAFLIKADNKARQLENKLQNQFIRDQDIIRDLEQKRDTLQLYVVELKSQIVELQKTQTILKRKISENKDKYHDIVLDLEAKVKEDENVVLKIGRSLQGMFMLGPKPMSFYDPNVKHGLGYENPYTLKKAISQNPKLYDASCFGDTKIHMHVRDIEDILDDATKNASSVRGKSTRDSSFKNSILANTKKSSERVEVSDRTNKKPDVASKSVVLNKKIVTDVDVKNALKAKDVLCVSYAKNVLISCHDKCLANYKLNVHSKVRRALFTTPRIVKSKFEDTTHVVLKTRFSVKTTQSKSLDTTTVVSKTKITAVPPLREDLLTGARESNLYTISISNMVASSPICLLSKAISTKSWLWHRRLSHLNFGTINDLTKHDLVDGLPKFKYDKDHLCSACERGKSKKSSHPPKLVPSTHSKLELLHMDLCGPMRVASINGKKYILVIVDDYSRFTWVYFLHTKDETPEIIKKFIAQAQLNYDAKIHKIRTNNGTELKNANLKAHYEKLAMASEHESLDPVSQRFINNDSSAESMNTLSKEDLDNLFGPMYE